jgi:plasmid stabilization system protein ParE
VNYTVVYKPAAEAELAAIWMAATDRAAVTRAADALDRRLEVTPSTVGEYRPAGRRIAYELPLGITFSVDGATRTVLVGRVWKVAPPRLRP